MSKLARVRGLHFSVGHVCFIANFSNDQSLGWRVQAWPWEDVQNSRAHACYNILSSLACHTFLGFVTVEQAGTCCCSVCLWAELTKTNNPVISFMGKDYQDVTTNIKYLLEDFLSGSSSHYPKISGDLWIRILSQVSFNQKIHCSPLISSPNPVCQPVLGCCAAPHCGY